ncbi:hypothetical protein GTP46_14135 [Duganella sp. FT135W]|uniref:Tetratricopeptide repeat protein n=1 Tax=Duganella flavida TaxID=2692175 RepID=A0A6L8K8G1_9BURK|nr:hypothetical protein [Duganella flavida]MYM23789.1 hypothetical protein [Duganella flavida]
MHGMQLVVRRRFMQAVEFLQSVRKDQPENIQAALWLYLAQEQADGTEAARSTLAALSSAKGEWWYTPVIDYYLGKTDANEAKDRAKAKGSPRHLCEASRFIGLKEMIDETGAKADRRDWTVDWCK